MLTLGGAPAHADDAMKLTLNFLAQPAQAGFFLAKEKGYYKDVGIDMTIVEGKGSSTTAQITAAGQNDVGFINGGIAINFINKGAPLQIIAAPIQGNFMSVGFLAKENIKKPQDLIGKTDADFNSKPEEVAQFRRIDVDVMESLSERRIAEEEITDASGKVHVLQTVKRPIVGPDNRVHQLLGTATDITARKRAEQSIRLAEEFNRSILASLQDYVVLLDRDGVLSRRVFGHDRARFEPIHGAHGVGGRRPAAADFAGLPESLRRCGTRRGRKQFAGFRTRDRGPVGRRASGRLQADKMGKGLEPKHRTQGRAYRVWAQRAANRATDQVMDGRQRERFARHWPLGAALRQAARGY